MKRRVEYGRAEHPRGRRREKNRFHFVQFFVSCLVFTFPVGFSRNSSTSRTPESAISEMAHRRVGSFANVILHVLDVFVVMLRDFYSRFL